MNTQITSENTTSMRMVRLDSLRFLVVLCLFKKREADARMRANLQGMDRFPYLVRVVKFLIYRMVVGGCLGLIKQKITKGRLQEWLFYTIIPRVLFFGLKLVNTYKVLVSGSWQYNYSPAFWTDFLMQMGLFLACIVAALKRWPAAISRLALFSLGIYLIHPVFLGGLESLPWKTDVKPASYAFKHFIGALAVASISVWLIGRPRLLLWTIGLGPLRFSRKRKPRLTVQSPSILNHTKKVMQ